MDEERVVFGVGTEDFSQAEWVGDVFENKWKFDHSTKQWHQWNGKRWAPDTVNEIKYVVAAHAVKNMEEAGELEKKALVRMYSLNPIERALEALASFPGIGVDGSGWDQDPYLLGCENGIVDLRLNALVPKPTPDMLVTKTTGCNFRPFDGETEKLSERAPIFTKFLEEVTSKDPDLALFLLLWFGYSLFGFTPEQRFLIMIGTGRNGKGALKHALWKATGEYFAQPDANMYMRTRHGAARSDVARADLMALKGKRITCFSEPEGGLFSEESLKAHTGGDIITARNLYSNVMVSWEPTHSITFLVNNAPEVEDVGVSMAARVMVADFRERYDGPNEDRQLYQKLEGEKEEILAVLCWAAKAWYDQWEVEKTGLEMPARVVAASKYFMSKNDPIARCMNEFFETGLEYDCASAIAYEAYVRWHVGGEEDGEPMSQIKFSQGLERKGFKKERTRSGTRWTGLRPLSAWKLSEKVAEDG